MEASDRFRTAGVGPARDEEGSGMALGRFRSASVAPAESEAATDRHDESEQAAEARDQSRRMADALQIMLPAPSADDVRALIAEIVGDDPYQRQYQAVRNASGLLLAASGAESDELGWARRADTVIDLLMGFLSEHPLEPTLLNLLGVAYFELGFTPLAKRIFRTVLDLDPDNEQVRRNLAQAKDRPKGSIADQLPADVRTAADAMHADARALIDSIRMPDEGTISLCMIVKDEEEMLPGCLEAIHEFVDEIIICDTGSTDRTVEIAESFGATVVHFPWTGSFAEARNRSIEDATCDWILYVDADEHLADGDGPRLRHLTRRVWHEAINLVEFNYTGYEGAGTQMNHNALRLFQRRPEYWWKGRIHEQKLWAFPTYLPERFGQSQARINHYGYLKARVADKDKHRRNLELLEAEAAEEGADGFTEFNIGSEYAGLGEWASAIIHFERAMELVRECRDWQQMEYAPLLVGRTVTCRRIVGNLEGARVLATEALSWYGDYTDLVFEIGLSHFQEGDLASAEAALDRALSMGEAPARYPTNAGVGSYLSRILRSRVLRRTGRAEEAIQELDLALQEAPNEVPVISDLVEGMLEDGSTAGEVAQFIEARVAAPAEGTLMTMAALFHEHGAFDDAERYYQLVLDRRPETEAAMVGMGELRMMQGRGTEALEYFSQIPTLHPLAARAGRAGFLAALQANDTDARARMRQLIEAGAGVDVIEQGVYAAWEAILAGEPYSVPPSEQATAIILDNLNALARLELPDAFEQLVPVLAQALPDDRERRLRLAELYLQRNFADMAAEEFLADAQEYGPDARSLSGLAKAATMKGMYEDGLVFAQEALLVDDSLIEMHRLAGLLEERLAAS